MRHLPSFASLRAFESAARLGSFKLAAEALNLSTSAISHQIRSLENELGEALFERHAGGVVMTSTASRYLKYVRGAFDQLEKGTDAVRGKHARGSLRISLLSTLSTLWLIPQLESFNKQYPHNAIELIDHAELVDFNSSRIDAALRYDFNGKGEWRNLVAHPLLEEYVFPVCSQAYLQSHPEIVQLDWNDSHTLLLNNKHLEEWESWCSATGTDRLITRAPSQSIMDTSSMTLMAAANGLGIALGRTPFVDAMLDSGSLVRLHHTAQHRNVRHFLVYPADHANNPQLIQFRDWLLALSGKINSGYRKAFSVSRSPARSIKPGK